MNERDKELALQAWTENNWEGYLNIEKLISFIRADEREACAKVCEHDVGMLGKGEVGQFWTDKCAAAIRARENT